MLAAIKRCASLVEFSLITVKATWPGLMCFKPSLREINLQFGGKMEETRTMLHAAIPALRNASSKLESRSRCFPTPLVRNIFFATNAMGWFFVPPCVIFRKKFRKGKVTRRYCSVNVFRAAEARWCTFEGIRTRCERPELAVLVTREMQKQFAEWFTQRQNFSELVGGEIRTGIHRVRAFAADLDDADDAAVGQNRRTDDFLNGFRAFRSNFNAFEDTGVPHRRKIVHNFRAAVARSTRRKRGITGKRNVANIFKFGGI